jgi:histidinol dehydrogenase
MDLFAQAEHDEMAQSIHVTRDEKHHQDVKDAIKRLLPAQPRKSIIEQSLSNQGGLILAENSDQIVDIVNRVAPEHLELMCQDANQLLPRIRHAGSIFMGRNSAEVLGDYCAGPNHVLPTSGTARFSSPLGVYDFQKRSSVVRFGDNNVTGVAQAAAYLAGQEGLTAHQHSALYRIRDYEQTK